MQPLHPAVLADLELERVFRQSAAFERRLRAIGGTPPTARSGIRGLLDRMRPDVDDQHIAERAEFNGFECGAERMVSGALPHADVILLARRLERHAQNNGGEQAVAFAHALAGEAALHSGFLRLARMELSEAAELHHAQGSDSGEANALMLLAKVRFAEGSREAGSRLLEQALPRARRSRRARHLVPRIYGAMITEIADATRAHALVGRAASVLRADTCAYCMLTFAIPAIAAAADAGDIELARDYAELVWSASRVWAGTSLEAEFSEALAHLAVAKGSDPLPHLELAIAAFDSAGQPLDVKRCVSLRSQLYAASQPDAA
jgi:hypothetical protein